MDSAASVIVLASVSSLFNHITSMMVDFDLNMIHVEYSKFSVWKVSI
jgi:hypothetical protein